MKLLNSKQPTVIFIRGLPGSGKSYLARALQKKLGNRSAIMLDPDAINYDSQEYINHTRLLTNEGVDPKLHAYRFSRAKAYQAIADGKIIIWNQPFTNLEIFNKMTAKLLAQAAQRKTTLSILVVELWVDPQVAEARVALRKSNGGHGPSAATFARFINDYQSFERYGYNTIALDGVDPVSKSVEHIIKNLKGVRS